jgi:hypothetical protein
MKYAEHTSMKRIGPLAWPGALGLIVLMSLVPGIARAEDDQNSMWSLDKKIIYEVLRSFGMTPKRTLEDQIDTRERAPLVVPASRVPPPPQTAPAVRDPNWPVEADVSREAVKKRTANRKDLDPDQFTNPLRPSELAIARADAGAAAGAPSRSASDAAMTDTMRPSQLGSSSGLFGGLFGGNSGRQDRQEQQQVDTSAAEPPRTRLIDPPAGYQTPSPSQPYGTVPPANNGKPTKPADHALGEDVGL